MDIFTELADNLEQCLARLVDYEEAEEQGKLIKIPTEVYYLQNDRICTGSLLNLKYCVLSNPPKLKYTILDEESEPRTGTYGHDMFNTLEEINQALLEQDKEC